MKNDLFCQGSEYDCGPTTLMNAIRYLYEREEIDPKLFKGIWMMGNDTFDHLGEEGKHGTSKAAMRYLADWFNDYGKGWGFPIRAAYADEEEARVEHGSPVVECIKKGGCAVIRCWSGGVGHYVLLTRLEGDYVGLWDPYDEEPDFQDKERYKIVHGQPKVMNRLIRMDVFGLRNQSDYATDCPELREALMIWREEPVRHEAPKHDH